MKKILIYSMLIIALIGCSIISAFAGYYECDTCKADINSYCSGGNADYSDSHRYGLLWLNKCTYTVLAHTTEEECTQNRTHSDIGIDVAYGEVGHVTSDPLVTDVCGTKDTPNPYCPVGTFAYAT